MWTRVYLYLLVGFIFFFTYPVDAFWFVRNCKIFWPTFNYIGGIDSIKCISDENDPDSHVFFCCCLCVLHLIFFFTFLPFSSYFIAIRIMLVSVIVPHNSLNNWKIDLVVFHSRRCPHHVYNNYCSSAYCSLLCALSLLSNIDYATPAFCIE